MEKEDVARPAEQALVNQPPTGLGPSGFDPSRMSLAYHELRDCLIRRSEPTCLVRKEFLEVALDALRSVMKWENDSRWIRWDGGKCPVGITRTVDLKWNNGAVSEYHPVGKIDRDLWHYRGPGGHIVAYRLSRDSDASLAEDGLPAEPRSGGSAGRRHRPNSSTHKEPLT